MGLLDRFKKPNVEKLENDRDIESLIALLNHKDWKIRHAAVVALRNISDPVCVDPLIDKLKEEYLPYPEFLEKFRGKYNPEFLDETVEYRHIKYNLHNWGPFVIGTNYHFNDIIVRDNRKEIITQIVLSLVYFQDPRAKEILSKLKQIENDRITLAWINQGLEKLNKLNIINSMDPKSQTGLDENQESITYYKKALKAYWKFNAQKWWESNSPPNPICDNCRESITPENSYLFSGYMECKSCIENILKQWDEKGNDKYYFGTYELIEAQSYYDKQS